jgi:hypothetical protein
VIAVRAVECHAFKDFAIPEQADIREARVLHLSELRVVIHENQVILRHRALGALIPVIVMRVRENNRVALQNFLDGKRQIDERIPLRHVHRFREARDRALFTEHGINQKSRAAKRHFDRGVPDQLNRGAFIDRFHLIFSSVIFCSETRVGVAVTRARFLSKTS